MTDNERSLALLEQIETIMFEVVEENVKHYVSGAGRFSGNSFPYSAFKAWLKVRAEIRETKELQKYHDIGAYYNAGIEQQRQKSGG